MWWLYLIIGFVSGFLIANGIHIIRRTSGTLRIDHSNPEKDIYRFEINKIDNLPKKKKIVLKIDNDAELSRQ